MSKVSFNRAKKHSPGQEAFEWWLIITFLSFVVMFALLNWGYITNQVMNKLNNTLNSVNTNISTST